VLELQAIEMVVFLVAAIMIGSLIILFVTNLDAGKIFESIKKMLFPETGPRENITRLPLSRFFEFIFNCWQECEVGESFLKCGTVYITDGNSLNDANLQATFQKYNFCLDCNVSVEGNIELPAVVQVDCNKSQIKIKG
jgi:hypothetical protein